MKKDILKIILTSCILLSFNIHSYAQRGKERKADNEFDQYAYVDAIKIYENIAQNGYVNISILKKLADAYYFNGKFEQAHNWYRELFEGNYQDKGKQAVESEYYYRYAQTLKAAGNYEKSDAVMEEFAALEKWDSRVRMFESNRDYLKEIETVSDLYEIRPVSINSEYSDFGAAILDDQLIFTSARKTGNSSNQIHSWTNESFTSLYSTKINMDGSFGEVKLFSPQLDSKVINESTAVFTQDGNTMYFTRNNANEKEKKRFNKEDTSLLKIYKTIKQDNGSWSTAEELPFNSDNYNTAHPALTPDGKWLYFASDREGSYGQSDIYRVALYATGTYGKVENAGDKINTSGRETFPFISKDGYFYFASDGRPGLGGLDIYRAKLNVDGSFGKVVNLGSPINSPHDDFGFYIDPLSRKGFISSNRPGGTGSDDIYFFAEKICKQKIQGIIFDNDTHEVISKAEVVLYDSSYRVLCTIVSDEQGKYSTEEVNCGLKYRLKTSAENYNTVENTIVLNRIPGIAELNIGLEKTEREIQVQDDLFKKLQLNSIYFDFDKSLIRPDAEIELIQIVEVMKQYPEMKIEVRSYTDSRGDENYNMQLSQRRAASTADWIIAKGIDSSRVRYQGYGGTNLINKCAKGVKCSNKEHEQNRRSEFIVSKL